MTRLPILPRRRFMAGFAASCAVPALAGTARAQAYPDGPVQILVAYAPGGGTDTLARLLAGPLSTVLGQPVTVQNLPGGGGQVAATALLRDGADGLSILATNEPDLFMSTVFKTPAYRSSDFQTIMVDLRDPRVMLVTKESGINTLGDLVDRAKSEPGTMTVSVAQGSAQELFAKWLFGKLGLEVRLVGYDGGSTAANAMLAGDVVATIGDDFARVNLRDKANALFVGSKTKSPRWPEAVPLTQALATYGITPPSPNFLSRYGVYVVSAAFKTSKPEAYKKLQDAMIKARGSADMQQYIGKNNLKDLSVGRPGEEMFEAFSADFAEIERLK